MRAIRDALAQNGAQYRTANHGMTRIGFTYNQKPDPILAAPLSGESDDVTVTDDEPPSSEPPSIGAGRGRNFMVAPAAVAESSPLPDDEFAEWDTQETIDAVASALSKLGTVVRLEATPEMPERMRHAKVDIVFNMAEGLRGTNREALVPAICEYFSVPYS